MNTASRILTGIIGMVVGAILMVLGLFEPFALIYGIPVTLISIYIFFNRKEDHIEQIKR